MEEIGLLEQFDIEKITKCYPEGSIGSITTYEELIHKYIYNLRQTENWNGNINLFATFGFLQAGGNSILGAIPQFSKNFREDILPKIYNDEKILKKLYKWGIPLIKETFDSMDKADKEKYLETIDYAIKYMETTYNQQEESIYLEKLKKEGDLRIFIYERADGTQPILRDLEAWIARRNIYDRVPVQRMLRWAKKIRKDLE